MTFWKRHVKYKFLISVYNKFGIKLNGQINSPGFQTRTLFRHCLSFGLSNFMGQSPS
jgi:hypothetical protein